MRQRIPMDVLQRAYAIAHARTTVSDGLESKFGVVAEVLRLRIEGKTLKEIAAVIGDGTLDTTRVSQIIGRAVRYRGYEHERED